MISITPVPAFSDNYIWVVHNKEHAIVVDPGDAEPVKDFLNENGLELVAIFCTHHHYDHIAGIQRLSDLYGPDVYGPRNEKIPCITTAVGEGDMVEITKLDFSCRVIDIPGHTLGHVAYLWDGGMFCGDTLFGAGCGRIFEGTPAQMHDSLQRLAKQPDNTLVYCTHEFTESNLGFAEICEKNNIHIQQRIQNVRFLRQKGLPTLPSNIKLEKETNPFLRCTEPEILTNVGKYFGEDFSGLSDLEIFSALRKWRDLY